MILTYTAIRRIKNENFYLYHLWICFYRQRAARILPAVQSACFKIPGAESGKIYRRNNLIDIDCGCVTGHALCAYCIDTGETFYEPFFV